jgi:hypothetical protein
MQQGPKRGFLGTWDKEIIQKKKIMYNLLGFTREKSLLYIK